MALDDQKLLNSLGQYPEFENRGLKISSQKLGFKIFITRFLNTRNFFDYKT